MLLGAAAVGGGYVFYKASQGQFDVEQLVQKNPLSIQAASVPESQPSVSRVELGRKSL